MPFCYLDRDGVINHHLPYVGSIERFIWFDEIINVAEELKKYGYNFIMVTNQSGIGRGYYTIEDFNKLNNVIIERFKKRKLDIKIRFCPHTPSFNCDCRKPKIGMIKNDERSPKVIFIGDQESDMICAFNAGVKNRWLINSYLKSDYMTRYARNHDELKNNLKMWYEKDILRI